MTQVLHEPARVTHAATMEAAVVTDFGRLLQIREIEVPSPGFGKALVELEA